jgi:hydrogenase maturation protease
MPGAVSTHEIDVSTAIELARAIGRMPARLLLIGIEAAQTDWCTPPSPAVEAAIDSAVDLVDELLAGQVAPGQPAANVVS